MSEITDLIVGSCQILKAKESLKKLREMCIQPEMQTELMKQIQRHHNYLVNLSRFMVQMSQQGQIDASIQSFFLQFIANIVTANEANASYLLQNLQLIGKEGQKSRLLCTLIQQLCLKSNKNRRFVHVFLHNTIFAVKNTIPWTTLWQGSLKTILSIVFSDLKMKQQNNDEQLDKIFQWKCNIIKLLMDYPNKTVLSASQLLISLSQEHKAEMIHLIYLLLDKMINNQCSSTFVKQLQVPMFDIRQMHMKPYALKFCLDKIDIEYLIRLFTQQLEMFKKEVKSMEQSKSLEVLGQLIQLFSCVTFLGGYNAAVQNLFHEHIHKFSEFLKITYLLYSISRQYEGLKQDYKTPYTYNQQLNEQYQQMFNLQADQYKIHEYYSKTLNSDEIFGVIIRFLSNLIHINPKNQQYFEQHFKTLFIIMSLTHMDEKQQTMREWALIFIRNVCEVSQQLRQRIESMKVDVKSV